MRTENVRLRLDLESPGVPELWREDEQPPYFKPLARMVQISNHPMDAHPQTSEEARRLVACWNYCEGIPTDLLEDCVISGLVNRQILAPMQMATKNDNA